MYSYILWFCELIIHSRVVLVWGLACYFSQMSAGSRHGIWKLSWTGHLKQFTHTVDRRWGIWLKVNLGLLTYAYTRMLPGLCGWGFSQHGNWVPKKSTSWGNSLQNKGSKKLRYRLLSSSEFGWSNSSSLIVLFEFINIFL